MADSIYDSMAIPDACYLGKRIFKKLFHENANLGATDKKAFREDIDTIEWLYTLKPSTINIQPYADSQREYEEIAILQVNLRTQRRTTRIAEIIHRAIPYPLLIVFSFNNLCALSTAHKRFSAAEKGEIVAEDIMLTSRINLSSPTAVQKDFIENLLLDTLPQTNFFALYSALAERLLALDCAEFTGEYRLESQSEKKKHRREQLAECHKLEVEIEKYRKAIKEESQFNRQVELNAQLKELQNQFKRKIERL